MKGIPRNGGTRTVMSRVMAILGAFDPTSPRLSLTQISRRTEQPLSTVHRIVGELVDWQVLTRGEDGLYRIGLRMWELGELGPGRLREIASPWLNDLYAEVRENVHLAIRDGREAVYLEKVHGRVSIPILSRVGGRLPLHTTGVGKVLLAYAPSQEVHAYLTGSLERPTPYSLIEPGRLLRDLELTRGRGYASTREEMSLGSCSLAVPVHDPGGQVAAAVGLVVPTRRISGQSGLLRSLERTAQRITMQWRECVELSA